VALRLRNLHCIKYSTVLRRYTVEIWRTRCCSYSWNQWLYINILRGFEYSVKVGAHCLRRPYQICLGLRNIITAVLKLWIIVLYSGVFRNLKRGGPWVHFRCRPTFSKVLNFSIFFTLMISTIFSSPRWGQGQGPPKYAPGITVVIGRHTGTYRCGWFNDWFYLHDVMKVCDVIGLGFDDLHDDAATRVRHVVVVVTWPLQWRHGRCDVVIGWRFHYLTLQKQSSHDNSNDTRVYVLYQVYYLQSKVHSS